MKTRNIIGLSAIAVVAVGSLLGRHTPRQGEPVSWELLDTTTGEIVNSDMDYQQCLRTKASWQAYHPDHWIGCQTMETK